MNLVGFAEQCGRYAQGEDALFKVLRLAGPDPRVVARGKAFYEALKKLDDAQAPGRQPAAARRGRGVLPAAPPDCRTRGPTRRLRVSRAVTPQPLTAARSRG